MLRAMLCDGVGVLYEGHTVLPGATEAGLEAILPPTGKYRPGDEPRLGEGGRGVEKIGSTVRVILTAHLPT